MKTKLLPNRHPLVFGPWLLAVLSIIANPTAGIAQQQSGERDKPLETSDVLAMKRDGIGESVIVAAVKHAPVERLDGSPEALASLRTAGLGESTISAVVERVQSHQKTTSPQATVHARTATDVKLFFVEKPTQTFKELGRISVSKYGTLGRSKKREAIDEDLKNQAIGLGGDAVINITEDFASISGVVVRFE
ncbi:MAG TPA: hypothetical protein VGS22_06015 [Thermoanaerobaculia bacterium]|jgi:hypothetical protein|nr:hypothetical protein [Thermoanaerobaculia bacterium]